MLWLHFFSKVNALFGRWQQQPQVSPQESISLIPPVETASFQPLQPATPTNPSATIPNVTNTASAQATVTVCPLQAYVSRNMSHAFWPAINGTDHCEIQQFCQNRTASLYCYHRSNMNETCWPVMVVACPSGLVMNCAEGFVCDDGSLPWWRDQSRRNPLALPVCRAIFEDVSYDGSLLRNQTCPTQTASLASTDGLGPSGVKAPSWATCIVTASVIATCPALPIPTRLPACSAPTQSTSTSTSMSMSMSTGMSKSYFSDCPQSYQGTMTSYPQISPCPTITVTEICPSSAPIALTMASTSSSAPIPSISISSSSTVWWTPTQSVWWTPSASGEVSCPTPTYD